MLIPSKSNPCKFPDPAAYMLFFRTKTTKVGITHIQGIIFPGINNFGDWCNAERQIQVHYSNPILSGGISHNVRCRYKDQVLYQFIMANQSTMPATKKGGIQLVHF